MIVSSRDGWWLVAAERRSSTESTKPKNASGGGLPAQHADVVDHDQLPRVIRSVVVVTVPSTAVRPTVAARDSHPWCTR